jgi:hypothetical protein
MSRHAGGKTRDHGGDHNKTNGHPFPPIMQTAGLDAKIAERESDGDSQSKWRQRQKRGD